VAIAPSQLAGVVCKGYSLEAFAVWSNIRVLCKLVAREQGKGHPSGLEEYDALGIRIPGCALDQPRQG
jgi:hypothetical protein